MTTFKNFTPHDICLNDGTILKSEGVARVAATFSQPDNNGCMTQEFGEITGLPEESFLSCRDCNDFNGGIELCRAQCQPKTIFIVSALVLAAAKAAGRTDCVAPASGHPDTVRNEKGHIVSVPGIREIVIIMHPFTGVHD